MSLLKTSAIVMALALTISPVIAKEKVSDAYKDRDRYNFEPAPPEPIRKVKTKIEVKTISPNPKEIKVKDKELKELLKAINILVDNDRKIEKGAIKVHWYKKVKSKQYGVIKKIVSSPKDNVFAAPSPPSKSGK